MSEGYEKLLGYAFFLLSRRRYTVGQMKKKLVGREVGGAEDVEKVIGRLLDLKYLDDELFVQEWVRQRRSLKPRGMYMLKRELKMKGIDEGLISQYVNDELIDESADAQAFIEKKRRVIMRVPEERQRDKVFSLLKNRGFSLQAIYKVLDSW